MPRSAEECEIKPTYLSFKYPNVWMNHISEKIKVMIYFAPVDEENTILYIRFYNKLTNIAKPGEDRLARPVEDRLGAIRHGGIRAKSREVILIFLRWSLARELEERSAVAAGPIPPRIPSIGFAMRLSYGNKAPSQGEFRSPPA